MTMPVSCAFRKLRLRHHQTCWLNSLAEYQYTMVQIPGQTNPADFLTRKRFSDCQRPALTTGYDDLCSSLELFAAAASAAAFTHAGTCPDAPAFCTWS